MPKMTTQLIEFLHRLRGTTRKQALAATLWSSDFRLGLPVGIGVGIWCAYVNAVRTAEPTVLENAGVGAIGLLAVTLAAMAFLLAFMDPSYSELIKRAGGVQALYRPFRTAAVVSGAAALVCFVGAVDADSGPVWLQAALFALGMAPVGSRRRGREIDGADRPVWCPVWRSGATLLEGDHGEKRQFKLIHPRFRIGRKRRRVDGRA